MRIHITAALMAANVSFLPLASIHALVVSSNLDWRDSDGNTHIFSPKNKDYLHFGKDGKSNYGKSGKKTKVSINVDDHKFDGYHDDYGYEMVNRNLRNNPKRKRTLAKATNSPTLSPSVSPTESPTCGGKSCKIPTHNPTLSPTESPTLSPSLSPIESPTEFPTIPPVVQVVTPHPVSDQAPVSSVSQGIGIILDVGGDNNVVDVTVDINKHEAIVNDSSDDDVLEDDAVFTSDDDNSSESMSMSASMSASMSISEPSSDASADAIDDFTYYFGDPNEDSQIMSKSQKDLRK